MRLSCEKQRTLRKYVSEALPENIGYDLKIFGSRLDDQRKGGDLDIYLETNGLNAEQRYELKLKLRPVLEEALDLPIDLIIQDAQSPLMPVSRIARAEGISL